MVVVLLPTVTFVARHAFTAPTHLRRLQCFFCIPARAAFGLVVVKVRSSPKILDIMGIHTLLAVVFIGVGAPHCLVQVNHELRVLRLLMNKFNRNLGLTVCE